MSDMYCVFGNPVAHSKSPAIHAAFAAATGQDLIYEARLAPVDGFAAAVADFVAHGGRGANVTVPFKEEAFHLCQHRSPRAELAGAVNTLVFAEGRIIGDNTDGAGLVRDMVANLGLALAGKRVLLLGAGGAARGVMGPLLAEKPGELMIANRTAEKAVALANNFAEAAAQVSAAVDGGDYEKLPGRCFDVVINATSASLAGARLPLPAGLFADNALAYDMMYGRGDTPFMAQARACGVQHCADGLGMLVEQAAEAFFVWRNIRPSTMEVLSRLRVALNAG